MRILQRFRTGRRRAGPVILGLAILPLMGGVGAAFDYGRAASARSRLQQAVDLATVVLAREAGSLSAAYLQRRGEEIVRASLAGDLAMQVESLAVARGPKILRVAVAGSVPTSTLSILGIDRLAIAASAESRWGSRRIEVALVLDNTGSMGWLGKMDALKDAAKTFLDALGRGLPNGDTALVSLVPFNAQVRVDPARTGGEPPWLAYGERVDPGHWSGYVEDRAQPHDVSLAAPDKAHPETLYPAARRAFGQDLAPMHGLTRDFAALRRAIDAMQPAGNGNTAIGLAWGLAALTPGGPLGDAAPFGAPDVEKTVVVLVDGDNTQSRINGQANSNGALIDGRMLLTCDTVNRAGIRLHTVRLVEGNEALLRACASRDGEERPLYHDVQNPAYLGSVFRAIARDIVARPLTH